MKTNIIYGENFYGVDNCVTLLRECLSIFSKTSDLLYTTNLMINGEMDVNQENSENFIITLEDYFSIDRSSIVMFHEYKYPYYADINKRLHDFNEAYTSLKEVCDELSTMFIPPTLEELEEVRKYLETILCNISIFTYRQFKDNDYDYSLQVYSSRFGIKIEDIHSIFDLMAKVPLTYRRISTVFDEYSPEDREIFISKIGDDFLDFDFLNDDLINKVINGNMGLEELREEIANLVVDLDEE